MYFWSKLRNKLTEAQGDMLSPSLLVNLRRLKDDYFADVETIIYREFRSAPPHSRHCTLVYTDNMAKHEYLSHYILRPVMGTALPKRLTDNKLAEHVMETVIFADGVDAQCHLGELAEAIMGGAGVLLIDRCSTGVVVDAQGWEKRAVTEPISENVVRGPREGFTEDLGVGLALLRRKIKCSALKVKYLEVGRQTRTKVAVTYLQDVANGELVDEVMGRIEDIEIDGVLDSGYIEELIRDAPYSPFPTVASTERPDVVAAALLEGRVGILVDGTPFALTVPFFFMESFQANEDYFKNWLSASFQRFLRYICFFLTTSVPALYLALITYHPQLIPTELVLSISASRKEVPFPAVVEIVAMGLMFEILREAGIRLPQPIGDAVSIVGAVVLGEAAVAANLVSAPMIIVVGITGIAGFATPMLHGPAVLLRFLLVLLATVFGLYGYFFGLVGLLIHLSSMHSFGAPYLTGYTSLRVQEAKDTMIRAPWWWMGRRPRFLASRNRVRLRSNRP